MKLRGILLSPFAGFRERSFEFGPGLNVVLGANDVGKSTLFRALEAAFFLPSRVSKSTKEGREILPRVIPLGGDHARVKLSFSAGGGEWKLEKSWGQGASVALDPPEGARVIQEEKIDEQLQALLPATPAAFQNVLFMGQGALEGTLAALDAKRDTLHSLGDLLRCAVDQTAGISVDGLKHRLAEKIAYCLSHWDIQAGLPEKGRGIENPWQKDKGSVLEAYYARETALKAARGALELESKRDHIFTALSEKKAKREAGRAFVAENKKFVEAARERQALSVNVGRSKEEVERLLQDLDSWNKAEVARDHQAPEVRKLADLCLKLEEERKAALTFAKRRDSLARLEKARAAGQELAEAQKQLATLPKMKGEDLKRLRAAVLEVDALKAGLKSGKIQLQFSVKGELPVTMRKDMDDERKGVMTPGRPLVLNAGGRIQLSSELFELQVTSGDGKLGEIEEQLTLKTDALAKLFAASGVKTLDEAQELQEKTAEAEGRVKSSQAVLANLLGAGEKLADLEKFAAEAGPVGTREPELVLAELQSTQRDLSARRDTLVRSESALKLLGNRYAVESSARLMEKLLSAKTELASWDEKLKALPELPVQAGDLASFLTRFETADREAASLAEEVQQLSIELAELQARLPEESAEDLERIRRESETAFERELARARALLRVEEALKKVEKSAGDIFEGFRAELEEKVAHLSGRKYKDARISAEGLPTDFLRSDGAAVPYGWLSAGTKDAFALSLRLAMAGHFLGKADGFLLLDDPLVNMDPERQQAAAGILRAFAEKRQVVLFTCHPAHAELLGGKRLDL
ncbi:MAG TPA: AAA family ATPase [Bdellovibrionota bacterium]|jgi:hypothetical protein